MEFVLICVTAVVVGLRGFRASRRTYTWSAVLAVAASIYLYHYQ